MEPAIGFEPITYRLQGGCSTEWAKLANINFFIFFILWQMIIYFKWILLLLLRLDWLWSWLSWQKNSHLFTIRELFFATKNLGHSRLFSRCISFFDNTYFCTLIYHFVYVTQILNCYTLSFLNSLYKLFHFHFHSQFELLISGL